MLTASFNCCHLCLTIPHPSVMMITITKVLWILPLSIVMVITITVEQTLVTVTTITGIVFYLA